MGAGVLTQPVGIVQSKKNAGYFGVKRFDRIDQKRIHMHTVSGLAHADHRVSSLDYETIMKITQRLTKNNAESEKQYRVAVFNALTHNRDDHAKNFSFLMDEEGSWSVSPAYDLTFSSGPAGEHCTTVMGEGKNPSPVHLLKLAEASGIQKQKAVEIIAQVKESVERWKKWAEDAGVKKTSLHYINEVLKKQLDR